MAPPFIGETGAQHGIAATAITTAILTNLMVGARLLVRKFIVKSLSWDDLAIVLALTACNIGTALVLVQVHYGFGRHRAEIPVPDYIEYLRFSYLEWIQTFQTLMLTKIAICCLLLRIVISRAFTYTLWVWIALLLASNIVVTFIWMAQCHPIWLAWQSPLQPGACLSEAELLEIIFAQAIVSVVSDFILSAYPIFIIYRLRMSIRRKIGLSLLMGLGVLTGSLCIARTVLNWQNVNADSSSDVIPNWYLRSLEVLMGFFAACVPALYPGYRYFRIWLRGGQPAAEQAISSDKETSPAPLPGTHQPTAADGVLDSSDVSERSARHTSGGTQSEGSDPAVSWTGHGTWFIDTPGRDVENQREPPSPAAYPPRNFSRVVLR